MKKVIKIVYCDLGNHLLCPFNCKYQRTACEFLLGSNYCNALFKYFYKSGLPVSISENFEGNCKVGYTIYLDYKRTLKC